MAICDERVHIKEKKRWYKHYRTGCTARTAGNAEGYRCCLLYTSKLNLYIMDHTHIDRDILYIDGTKYEAYANKMTFVWKKATDKFYARNWAKAINVIRELNTYFNERNVDIHYSILKKPNFLYLLKITAVSYTHLKLFRGAVTTRRKV